MGRTSCPTWPKENPCQRPIFWEMNDQTAVRQGPWKLVLNGRLIEGAPAEDALHLSNLGEDMGEQLDLAQAEPERAAELKALAEAWRAALEARWQCDQSAGRQGLVTH